MALLVSMTALWVFAAVVTLREGLNLLFVSTLDTNVGRPTEALIGALQHERKLSVSALGAGDTAANRQELTESRTRTDTALTGWRSLTGDVDTAASQQLLNNIGLAAADLDRLTALRTDVDSAKISRPEVLANYTSMIDSGFRIYASVSAFDDQEIAKESRALITLTRGRELLAQEDALLAGALSAESLSGTDVVELTKLVGAQRFLYSSTAAELPPDSLALYEQAVAGPAVANLRRLEDQLLANARAGEKPPITADTWASASAPAIQALREMELAAADKTLQRVTPAAIGVIVRLILAGGLGLIAVITAVIISVTTARALVAQLEKLREAARDLADNRLPRVVQRLSTGEQVDVAAEAPPLSFGNDEIGQVGQAFNAVQQTAIEAAVQQADLRRGVRDVFLNLARRTQNLVHKQLGLLDTMERRESDPEEMDDLFRLDHLATRMRRNAENLIVLSGATAGRTWRLPVPLIDVVRGALAEVEDYTRVSLLPVDAGALAGRAVGDVIHLLAELIENAVSFSPPYTTVNVGGQAVANGFVVEVEDRGLGMTDDDLAVANQQLAEPPDFSLADPSRLGHYVVAKLAQRHGIKVHLRHSPYGGTVAIVLIPASLVVEAPDEELAATGAPARRSVPHPRAIADQLDLGALPQPATAAVTGSAHPVMPRRRTDTSPSTAPAMHAPTGLPARVRQASIAPQLRDALPEPDGEPTEEIRTRDPEQVRAAMSSFQLGTRLGRSDAATTDEYTGRHDAQRNDQQSPAAIPAAPRKDEQ
ncbi:sensor histidine kinase [Catellatospora chokoriensis]|uniref:sensor histidine kinase n=1 Tax=Catellatospora chokoriensis TaxID=310353 RepID=UPI001EF23341|nr:nitrate- and nitrite sensing domain-containing protein [Catellatospora chokoriensis]